MPIKYRNIWKTIRQYGIRSVFYRYFLSSLVIIALLFTAFSVASGQYYRQSVTKEISLAAASNTLKAKNIFEVLNTEFNQNYKLARRTPRMKSFLNAENLDGVQGADIIWGIYGSIVSVLQSTNYIADINVYAFKSNYLISSTQQKTVLPDNTPEWLKTWRSTQLDNFAIPRKSGSTDQTDTIYLCKTLKTAGRVTGLFCAQIRYDIFEELAQIAFAEESDHIYIISDIGLILYSNDPSLVNSTVFSQPDLYHAFSKAKESSADSFEMEERIISVTKDKTSGMLFLSGLDKQHFTSSFLSIHGYILAATFTSLIAAILLALFFSLRHYRSVAVVLQSLENPLDSVPKALSEFFYIADTVSNISRANDTVKGELTKKARLLQDAQISILQAQLTPHFLFNALQLINCSILKEVKSDNASIGYISDLCALLRTTYDTKNYFCTVKEEFETTKRYLSIQQGRYRSHLQIHYYLDKAAESAVTLKLLLQPLVENAVLHGFPDKEGVWQLNVCCYREGDYMVFEVVDNGTGIHEQELQELNSRLTDGNLTTRSQHIGVANVAQRIKLVFGASSSVTVYSVYGKGTAVIVKHKFTDKPLSI